MKRYRDKMKTDTDKYEQIKKEWNKKNVKIKEKKEWHSNAGRDKEIKKRTTKKIQRKTKSKKTKKQTNKQTNKQSHLVHPIKEMNGKKSKQFKRKMR